MLLRWRFKPEVLRTIPNKRIVIGKSGKHTATRSMSTSFFSTWKVLSPSSRSFKQDYAMVESRPVVDRSDLKQFQNTSPWWARGAPTWIDFHLSCQTHGYKKKDKSSVRVKPLLVSVVAAALTFAIISSPSMEKEAISNMICITFFYCMRPGEYTGTPMDDQVFAFKDIGFYIGLRCLNNKFCCHFDYLLFC